MISRTDMIERALEVFPVADPALVRARALQRRIDAKYVTTLDRVPELLDGFAGAFAVMPVGASHVATYENLYFDTPELTSFHDHRRGRRVRQKVRIRRYPERELGFLEVKTKRSDWLTIKVRHPIAPTTSDLDDDARAFLAPHVADPAALSPILRVDFRRIMLLGLDTIERVTIDLELAARSVGRDTTVDFGAVVVVEVKRATEQPRGTPAMRAISRGRLRERSISKYCASLVRLSPDVRHNRLLPTLRALEAFQ